MRILALILLLACVSCARSLVVHDFGRTYFQGPPDQTFSLIVKTLSGLGYTIDFADEKNGIINTGWYSYNAQRGLARISYGLQSRAIIMIKENSLVDVKYETQASYGSAVGGQYWQPIYDGDVDGLRAANTEHQRLKEGLSAQFKTVSSL